LALKGTGVVPILLKGAAFVVAGLPAGRGRCSNDIDILVSRSELQIVEQSLVAAGWQSAAKTPYDDRYYREWMHELPPLVHPARGSVIDVHHNILPVTGRLKVDANLLIRASQPAEGGRFRVLSPEDMVLHTAAHLFQDGEIYGSLREIIDLDLLLRHFAEIDEDFWDRLIGRSRTMNLTRPLYYALHTAERLAGTPIPASTLKVIRMSAPLAPVRQLMDFLIEQAIVPDNRDGDSRATAAAKFLLYLRSHYLRMPPGLLVRHLFHKWWRNKV
jgi:hypothetical protein